MIHPMSLPLALSPSPPRRPRWRRRPVDAGVGGDVLDARRFAGRGTDRDRRPLLARRRQRLRRHDLRVRAAVARLGRGGQPRRARPSIPDARRVRSSTCASRCTRGRRAARTTRGATSAASTSRPRRGAATSARSSCRWPVRAARSGSTATSCRRAPVGTRQGARRGVPDRDSACSRTASWRTARSARRTVRGTTWTAGVGWAGRYIMFVTDTATGNKVTALVDIAAGRVPDDRPRRDLLRFRHVQLPRGRPGHDGRHVPLDGADPHPRHADVHRDHRTVRSAPATAAIRRPIRSPAATRRPTTTPGHRPERHPGERRVGRAAQRHRRRRRAPGPGFMSVIPKPARVGDVFNDQGSYGAFPNTSNLNLESGDPTPNLVLARVGAGGKIRIYNYLGPTHVIADVAGWFGTGGAHTDGTGFTGVVPSRVLDSRPGSAPRAASSRAGETRNDPGGRRRRDPDERRERRGQRHDDRLARFRLRHRVPDGRRPARTRRTSTSCRAACGRTRRSSRSAPAVRSACSSPRRVRTSSSTCSAAYGPGGGRVTTITPERFGRQPRHRNRARPFGEDEVAQHPDRRPRQRPGQRDRGDRQRDGRRTPPRGVSCRRGRPVRRSRRRRTSTSSPARPCRTS